MIRLKTEKEKIIWLVKPGSMAAANNQDAGIVPFDGLITAVMAQCGVVGTDGTGSPTADILVDLNKNGTTFVGTTKITFTHTALLVTPSSYGSLVGLAPVAVSKGDVLSLDTDVVLNGTTPVQPLNFSVAIKVSRVRGGGNPAAIITGSLE